jgi:hypothetical protein
LGKPAAGSTRLPIAPCGITSVLPLDFANVLLYSLKKKLTGQFL